MRAASVASQNDHSCATAFFAINSTRSGSSIHWEHKYSGAVHILSSFWHICRHSVHKSSKWKCGVRLNSRPIVRWAAASSKSTARSLTFVKEGKCCHIVDYMNRHTPSGLERTSWQISLQPRETLGHRGAARASDQVHLGRGTADSQW